MIRFQFKRLLSVSALLISAACTAPQGNNLDNSGQLNSVSQSDYQNLGSTKVSFASTSKQKYAKPKAESKFRVYLTGYSYWDNTPRGSARIARPVIHRSAGGIGTYDDPITIAVGHVKKGSRSIMDFPAATKFYVERLRKYAIVEDLCGDGNQPQNGPCHSGYNGHPWLDIYVGGSKISEDYVNKCMYRITGLQNVIINPRPGYPVAPGEITATGCQTFG